jgi:A/G-specific adenine glycosylase
LLDHFDRQQRDLPWRRFTDPYRVWISEVMLQQTRVQTAAPYFQRWLSQFPDLETLAEAPLDAVLKAWEGLGYYARARNLHRCAQVVRQRFHGNLPGSVDELQSLPGIGEYTAGAIASIAYGTATPAVDGNVKRVLCRLLDTPQLSASQLRHHAARLVPLHRPGDFNQALMELGATICAAKAPRCSHCPVSEHCLAFRRGTQHLRPATKRPPPVPDRYFVVLVLLDRIGNTMLHRRPHDGLLGGLWEFPTFEAKRPGPFLRRLLGDQRVRSRKLCALFHPFTHFRAHYDIHLYRLASIPAADPEFPIVPWADLAGLAMSAAQRQVCARVAVASRRQAG